MFTVNDQIQNGSSGWDSEDFGPFADESAAENFARRLASEGYTSNDGEVRAVSVRDDGCNYGGEPRHALFCWTSDEDDDNTVHSVGPSDAEKESLRMAD